MRPKRIWLALACGAALALACATTADEQAYTTDQAPPGPPPAQPPPPPPGQPFPDGQWVFTQQYGWVWMPYGDTYTYAPASGTGEPVEYVFFPSYGWTWVAAPWVWGYGPRPSFGRAGPRQFAWVQHGWWRSPNRWHYVPYTPQTEAHRRGVRPAPAQRAARGPPRATPPARRGGEQRGGEARPDGGARGGEGRGGDGGGGYVPRGRDEPR